MFEGFPFLRGQALGYRAYFLATFIVASLYQLLLVAVFHLASPPASRGRPRRRRGGRRPTALTSNALPRDTARVGQRDGVAWPCCADPAARACPDG